MKTLYKRAGIFFIRHYAFLTFHLHIISLTAFILTTFFNIASFFGILCYVLCSIASGLITEYKRGRANHGAKDVIWNMLVEEFNEEKLHKMYRKESLKQATQIFPLAVISYFVWVVFAIATLF